MEGCGWSWNNWFLTGSTVWGASWWSWKKIIFNSFYFKRVLSCLEKNWFFTVSTFGGCGGFQRTHVITLSTLRGCGGLERHWFLTLSTLRGCGWSWKNWFLNTFYCGRESLFWKNSFLAITFFLKELIFNTFYIGEDVELSLKNWFLTVSTLKGCCCLEITDV